MSVEQLIRPAAVLCWDICWAGRIRTVGPRWPSSQQRAIQESPW